MLENRVCLLDSSQGVYIPQSFAKAYAESWAHLDRQDIDILVQGPDHEFYWETWDYVMRNAEFVDDDGKVWYLDQDGDLFAYCLSK
jgi:hypothetical protein